MPLTHQQWVAKYCPDPAPILMQATAPPPAITADNARMTFSDEYRADPLFARMGITLEQYIESRSATEQHAGQVRMAAAT